MLMEKTFSDIIHTFTWLTQSASSHIHQFSYDEFDYEPQIAIFHKKFPIGRTFSCQ